MVPRSGCRRMRTAGIPAMASITATSRLPTRRPHRLSVRSATTRAIPMTTASLANSEGWIDMPPSWSHEREPLIVEPATRTSTRPTTLAT